MMYPVSSELYRETAERLLDAVGARNYFSGSVFLLFDGAECRLTASVIVCRERRSLPEGDIDAVTDFVPVWWEFHTSVDGAERLNDFSFSEVRRLLG